MNFLKRRMMLLAKLGSVEKNTGSEDEILPSEYTRVSYVTLSNGQYVDLGIYATPNTRLEFKLLPNVNQSYWCGAREGADDNNMLYIYSNSPKHYGVRFLQKTDAASLSFTNEPKYVEGVIDSKHIYLQSDSEVLEKSYTTTNTNSTTRTVCFGKIRQGDGIYGYGNGLRGNVWYFKVYENDILILNLVPCIDSTGKACFYDTIKNMARYDDNTGGAFASHGND